MGQGHLTASLKMGPSHSMGHSPHSHTAPLAPSHLNLAYSATIIIILFKGERGKHLPVPASTRNFKGHQFSSSRLGGCSEQCDVCVCLLCLCCTPALPKLTVAVWWGSVYGCLHQCLMYCVSSISQYKLSLSHFSAGKKQRSAVWFLLYLGSWHQYVSTSVLGCCPARCMDREKSKAGKASERPGLC